MRQRWVTRVVAAVGFGVVPVLALSGAAVAEPPPRTVSAPPVVRLLCPGSGIVAVIDHAATGPRSTDTPLQIADRWAAALRMRARYAHLDRDVTYLSGTAATVAFTSGGGHVVAVLRYDNHPEMGWLLTSIERCG